MSTTNSQPLTPTHQDHWGACLPERGQAEGEEGQTGERKIWDEGAR